MQYTQQQYKDAINKAIAAGDRKSAEELAEEAAQLYGSYKAPEPTLRDVMSREVREFAPEVERRFARVAGEDPSILEEIYRAPEKAMIGVSQAARGAGEVVTSYIGSLLPESIKKGAENLFNQVRDTEAFKTAADAASRGFEYYSDWSERNPAMAERFEASIDVATLFGPRPDLKGVVNKTQALAGKAALKSKKKGVSKLIEPETFGPGDVVEEKGLLRSQEWQPKPKDLEVIDTLSNIKTVNPNRSYTYNYRSLQKDIDSSKTKVDNMIASQNKPIEKSELQSKMLEAINEFKTDPVFSLATGDAQKIASNLGETALRLVEKHGSDLKGILAARREFDKTLSQASANILGADSASGRALAAKSIRTILNDALKDNTVGDDLHNLLNRQHNSFLAMDAMSNKRAKELSNSLKRLTDGIRDVADLPKSPLALAATGTAAVGILGGVGTAAGTVAVGTGLYGAYQALKPKRSLKALTTLLSGVDKAIGKTTDPNALKQLRLDRIVLVDYINQKREEVKEEGAEAP